MSVEHNSPLIIDVLSYRQFSSVDLTFSEHSELQSQESMDSWALVKEYLDGK